MGDIVKLLHASKIEPRHVTPMNIWGDLCENIHLHYRNFRFDFSQKEFARFLCYVNQIHTAVNKCIQEQKYEEGSSNYLMQCTINQVLPADSDYYPNRLTIEEQADHTVHFHYRDFRLHMTDVEFKTIATAFTEALVKVESKKGFVGKDVAERTRMTVPIDSVQPYDEGHKPMVEIDKKHREGIEAFKDYIRAGRKLRPILVNIHGQRIDGFKRWMAYKELGYKEIDVIVDPFWTISLSKNKKMYVLGGQTNMSVFDDDSEDANMLPCPLCGRQNRLLVYIDDSGYWNCPCGIFYTDWKKIETCKYNKSYLERYTNYEKSDHYYDYACKDFFPKIEHLRRVKGGKFLELGFIYPQILNNAKTEGYETYGVEINENCVDPASPHKLFIGNYENIEIPGKFDVVWASHIFEHFHDPIGMIKKTYDLMNDGGVLFIAMPNPGSINPRNVPVWGHWNLKEHYIIFTLEKIVAELEKAGFTVPYSRENDDNRFVCIGDYHILATKGTK